MPPLSRFRPFSLEWLNQRIVVDPERGCWLWQPKNSTEGGYGRLRYDKKDYVAHVFVYRQLVGPIPEGMKLLHKCDVRKCVNPEHLFIGTQRENYDDMVNKGRRHVVITRGKQHLTKEQVYEVVSLCAAGSTQKEVANRFSVSEDTVRSILQRKTYKKYW